MKTITNLVCVCSKAHCPCKALDIRHYVCLPKEGFIPKDTSKPNSTLLIYRKAARQVVKPHSMHVRIVGSKLNTYHQIPKKTFSHKTTQSTPRCILTPRCLSCKKIQRKIMKFSKKRNNKHKKFQFLKRKNKKHIFYANKIKQKIDLPLKCLQHSNSIKSSCQGSFGYNVQLNKEILQSPYTNQNILQPKIKKPNQIPSLCKQRFRYNYHCHIKRHCQKNCHIV